MIKNTKQVQEAVGYLLQRFKEQTNIEGVLGAFITQVQGLEDVFWQLYTLRWPSTASGEQLDLIGRIVGEERQGKNDAKYALWLQMRIKINYSNGTPDELIALASAIENNVAFRKTGRASFVIEVVDATATPTELVTALSLAKGAATHGSLIYTLRPANQSFSFAAGATPETATGTGFSDVAQTTGGYLAGVLNA